MSIQINSDIAVCSRCGTGYGRRKGYFPVSYAVLHKGLGYVPVCRTCITSMYNTYLAQCNDAKDSVRQMCRKLDIYWNESIFEAVQKKSTPKTIMTQYIMRSNINTHAGKSYDDTLSDEGTLWSFRDIHDEIDEDSREALREKELVVEEEEVETIEISEDVKAFWGMGYTPQMYQDLEQRRSFWMSKFPKNTELDIGTEAIIRQICSLELDINRDRAAGRNVDRSITALNLLLGSGNLKPVQRKHEDVDTSIANTPMGVWLHRYENKRPLPKIDEDLKDTNGIRKYVFTWMGHLCKMLGLKNAYSQLYEDEIARLRVEKPEYDGDDDELFMTDLMLESENKNEGDD